MRYVWATATHVGLVREANEDAVFPETDGRGGGPIMAAVADGMGGHAAGEVASRVAMEAVSSQEAEELDAATRVVAANRAVLAAVEADRKLSGMGTTMTLGIFDENGVLHVGHVGDSRAYLFREGELRQITTDHTLVAELVAMGRLSSEALTTHPQRHMITRALGMAEIEVDAHDMTVLPGDRVLICSDGLTGMVTDAEIAQTLSEISGAEAAAWSLVEAANRAGGLDNTTVAIVDVVA
jgi:protein phosphatase